MVECLGQVPVLYKPNPNSQGVMFVYTSVDIITLNSNSGSEREMRMYTSIDVKINNSSLTLIHLSLTLTL